MSYTDVELVKDLQYVLMEPVDGLTFPSGLWTIDEITDRMNERQNRLLNSTALVYGFDAIDVAAQQARVDLPFDWLMTVEVFWQAPNGVTTLLERSDSFGADHGRPGWTTEYATPEAYLDYDTPNLILQLVPAPDAKGQVLLVYVPQGLPLGQNLATVPEQLTVPDEFISAVKYGTLADAFGKDGRGKDPTRAAYCEQRYALAQQMAAIILNGWV